jgi:hypothetical protein
MGGHKASRLFRDRFFPYGYLSRHAANRRGRSTSRHLVLMLPGRLVDVQALPDHSVPLLPAHLERRYGRRLASGLRRRSPHP